MSTRQSAELKHTQQDGWTKWGKNTGSRGLKLGAVQFRIAMNLQAEGQPKWDQDRVLLCPTKLSRVLATHTKAQSSVLDGGTLTSTRKEVRGVDPLGPMAWATCMYCLLLHL